MRDIAIVKSNVRKMAGQQAPENEIDDYISSEGYTINDIKNHKLENSKLSRTEAGARSALSGATFGFGDEAVAAGAAGLLKATGKGGNKSFSNLYREIKGEEEQALKQGKEQYPVQSFTAEFLPSAIIGGTGLTKAGLSGARTLLGKTLQGAAGGGLIGGLSGAGEAEDIGSIPSQVTQRAKEGAIFGGALSGGLSALRGAPGVAKKGIQKILGVKPETVAAFNEAGINPTLADVGGRVSKITQNALKNVPFANTVIEKATQEQINNISKQLNKITGSPGGTIQETGTTIRKGASDFNQSLRGKVDKLYNKLDNFLPKNTSVSLENTFKSLGDEYVANVAEVGAGDTARVIKRIGTIVENAQGKGNVGNAIPYQSLRIFRTLLRNKIDSPSIQGDEKSALTKIYSGLSADMRQAAATKGPEALKAFDRANNYFRISSQFREKNIEPLLEAKTPERVYQLALSGTKQGGSNVKQIMRVLNPEQKDFVRGTVAKQMGIANPGEQGAFGQEFSTGKFITEWNRLSPEARNNIFTSSQNKAIENLNKSISQIKESSKLKQTSNNLPYATLALGLTGPARALGGISIGTGMAKLMTNPKFINWLAKTTKSTNPTQFSNQLRKLSVIAAGNPDIREDILDYLGFIQTSNEQ